MNMSIKKIPCTKEELAQINEEVLRLVTFERPQVIEAIATAREFGDLSENAEYHAAKEKQSFIEGRINELQNFIAKSEVIDTTAIASDQVQFGATITVLDINTNEEKVYKIVGEYSSNPSIGHISYASPLARELINKKVDDVVELASGKGLRTLEIVKIEYK